MDETLLPFELTAVTAMVSRRFLLTHDLWEKRTSTGRVAPRWVAWEVLVRRGYKQSQIAWATGYQRATVSHGLGRLHKNPALCREVAAVERSLFRGEQGAAASPPLAFQCWHPLIPLVPWQELDDVLAYVLADLLEIVPAEQAARARGLCTLAHTPEAVRALTFILQGAGQERARSLLLLQVAALQSPRRR